MTTKKHSNHKHDSDHAGAGAVALATGKIIQVIGNVVDVPNYAVSTICPLEVFQK